ncbi:hypothetical protein Bbelb_302510 [Branchiostoma belcheri]|nr:hypothetical protein Bbelb_302510 [Branchiostoma belcheri]
MSDLGVTAKSDLKWDTHVARSVAKANSMLGFVKRTVGFHSNTDIRKTLYLYLVRCVLEYCSPLWSPTSRNLTSLIEGVQRRATKFILGPSSRQFDYKSRLACLGWLPLSYRREISDVVTFVKSRAKVYDTDIARLVNFSSRVPRSSRAHMLVPPRVKTSSYASSFLPLIITIWNKLDVETRALGANASSPTDAAAFKRKCRLFMRNRFNQHFSVDIPCSWVMSCGCTSCRATRPR